jgi:short-subunit dehydrogenase
MICCLGQEQDHNKPHKEKPMSDSFLNKRALITGASSGIGAELARGLATRGAHLVLVARRAERLTALAADLRQFGVKVEIVPTDLADAAAREALAGQFPGIDILVNNAGLGATGKFTDTAWRPAAQIIEINITALTHLTRLLAPGMAARGFGRILMVSSIAAYQPAPLMAVYAASKAYVSSFGLALNVELADRGVRTTVLCPGATESEFAKVASAQGTGHSMAGTTKMGQMTSAEVARIGLDALAKGRANVVAGRLNGAMALGTRLIPGALAARIAYRIMK